MCLAIPVRVKEINGNVVTVEVDGKEIKATNVGLRVKVGDYVVVQYGLVVDVLDEKFAKQSIETWRQLKAKLRS